jgi:hypothetical protein
MNGFMRPTIIRTIAMVKAFALSLTVLCVLAPSGQPAKATAFANRIAELSEPEGAFDTDNLISNERSYLHVVPALRNAGVKGGAYIGVGPDQNFSYIAQIRPAIAFIVDIRRDNLLLQLLFKALFAEAPTRMDYLMLLFGRAPPAATDGWRTAPIERLAAYVSGSPAAPDAEARRTRLDATLARSGVSLTRADLSTIHRFHDRFIAAGLSLKFESHGRGPRSYYPTYGELLLEGDRDGHHWNYLAADDDYQFVRGLEQRDLVIPVVGNLSGASALVKIGELLEQRGEKLSAFYTSNVEFYLFGDGTFPRYFENLRRLPHTRNSVIIRSMFDGYAFSAGPGYYSESFTQPIDDLLERLRVGTIRGYRDLAR